MGDMNIGLLNYTVHGGKPAQLTKKLLQDLNNINLKQVIKQATKVTATSKTLICLTCIL